ncbi:unnamed protein product [Rotaria sp. Silwood1]|nr:unnamed protein product [Rotaria sp. Silwood1]CAF0741821.1 unnamed protein product [Rotaria sp. Silwood1]CAF3350316.1 unnamed protein product [Rotaria sp. Silwood1]CAF4652165.1 unnamed protein product [Rotaria sp. Silwood1]
MALKSPRYCLYRDFVDAYMKGHSEMARCVSHQSAQTEWNQIKKDENFVKQKITEYLDLWNKAGQPEREPSSKKLHKKKNGTPKNDSRQQNFSSDDDEQNRDPNSIECLTPTSSKRKLSVELDELESELLEKEKSWIMRSAEKVAKKKAQTIGKSPQSDTEKVKTPAQESVLKDLNEISQRIANLIQVKSMGLLTAENQKTLKKLIEQKQKRTGDLKRLQSKQRASTRYREKQKRQVEKLCASNPQIAVELSKAFRPPTTRMQFETDCPSLVQIIAEIACIGGVSDDNKGKKLLSLEHLKDAIKERGYEIRKSSLYYRLMPQRALSHDGKKHILTVPVRLRKMQDIEPLPKHEDSHFTAASWKHIKDLAGIFGNDCVLYLTQDTKAKVTIGRPSAKGQSPLIMHLDYKMSSIDSQSNSIVSNHQFTPCVYAASIIDEAGLITNAGPTYISIRSAKHDRLTHESHSIDFDHLVQLKEFEKVAHDHLGRVKPIVIMNIDGSELENNTRYIKTLATAIDKFKKYNLDALIIVNQAPGQALFNVVERRLSSLAQDLAGLILPHDHFGTHLNDAGLTHHAELEKENFKLTGDVLAEVWSMNVLDEYPVVAEYINPSPMIDEQLKMADSVLALNSIIDRVSIEENEEIRSDQTRSTPIISTTEIKTECDIDEFWCATHVLQTQYTIQIIRCNHPSCCTPWRSNYIQVFPHRFLPPPVPFHRSSHGVKMADIETSSALTNPISPFYGNLFQRIQFHGIVINRTHDDLLPYDTCCPSLQTKISSRICSICKQYIPTSIRLRNHYKIHQQYTTDSFDYINNKEEDIIDDNDLNDPYDMPIVSINSTKNGVYLFSDMVEWLKSDFEDDPIVDTKVKSTAATASAMIRKEKQMAAAAIAATTTTTTIQEKSMTLVFNDQQTTTINEIFTEEEITTITDNTQTPTTCLSETQKEQGYILDALEKLGMLDDGASSIGNAPSQQSWDDLEDLVDNI